MGKLTYSEIEKDLPIIIKAELLKQDEVYKEVFAEEFGRKRKSLNLGYILCLLLFVHRWYITGDVWITLIQWVLVLCGGIGMIWIIADLFMMRKMIRERNIEIAKNILSEQKILAGGGLSYSGNQHQAQPTVINISNTSK